MKSRYIAFTQQPYCCAPTSLQMVMYRRNIPLIDQEDIGYELGLIVPEEDKHFFGRVRTGERPPAGWGTQIYRPQFNINKALKRLNVPFQVRIHSIDKFETAEKLKKFLQDAQKANGDVLLCYENSIIWDRENKSGHVVVFDYIEGDDVWVVDPNAKDPKRHKIPIQILYKAMLEHGVKRSAGCWEIF